ncbi:MAG: hypothetical protein B0W54_00495 [Cellvibrio sp. 79]|nr:MAG: hypothetical protein B0W54_00495 [Cellvibrio sp. 79]
MKSVTSLTAVSSTQRGFTLVEILIGVAIAGVLAAIAIPAYTTFIYKSDVRAAQSDLLSLSLKLESRYQRTLAYPILADDKKDNTDGIKEKLEGWSPNSNSRDFNFKFEENTESTYKITAEGKAGSRQKDCKISLTHNNERTTSNCKYLDDGKWL